MNTENAATGRYEIRVHGILGPLLLSTLPHTAATCVQRHSVLITRSSDGPDLVELLQLVIGSGLEVDSIRAIADDSSAGGSAA
jgi:hypothetical protein